MSNPQPMQPLELDGQGVLRFRANAIVRHLLDNGGIDMNAIARGDFTREDREQFAQLIGYSHSGSGGLGYMSDETWNAAQAVHALGRTEHEARADHLREQLESARSLMAAGVSALFGIHEDDLKVQP